jgi:hypothetical protein
MKRFTLLLKPDGDQDLSAVFEKQRLQHLAENNCKTCDKAELCPIKNGSISAHAVMATQVDTYEEIKGIIKPLYDEKFTKIIVLFDDKEDIIYIYKAEGSLHDIKKNILPPIVKIYEDVFTQEDCFFTVKDIRASMWFPSKIMN